MLYEFCTLISQSQSYENELNPYFFLVKEIMDILKPTLDNFFIRIACKINRLDVLFSPF